MNADPKAILAAALALPESDRAMIAERLLESLSLTTDGLDDEALIAELERRRAEHERDPSVVIPWSEFRWDDPS